MKRRFDYRKAEDDLYNAGCNYADEVYAYRTEESLNAFLRENGLNPEDYYLDPDEKSPRENADGGYVDEGCYVSTACIRAKGMHDDCSDLRILREYRDSYLLKKEGGIRDIARYYKTAPDVVNSIDSLPSSAEIWLDLYDSLVSPCVTLIRQGELEKVYEIYKNCVLELEKKYLNG